MTLVEKPEILRVLRGFNTWWTTNSVPGLQVKKLRRASFYEARALMQQEGLKRAVVLDGARRVGKTTILYQLADHLIRSGKDPRSVLYLTLEHPLLKLMSIDQILEIYDKEIAPTEGQRYILLDELQYVEDPTLWLKVLVDRHPDWKIIVTGSASIVFRDKDKESGVGRWVNVSVPTLSFYEYVMLKHYEKDLITPPEFEGHISPTHLGGLPPQKRHEIISKLESLRPEFRGYLIQGGFPETALIETSFAQRMLREDVVDKVLKRDMAAFYGISKLQELEKLFVYLCLHTGGLINEVLLSRELSIDRQTLRKFLDCLEGAHLVRSVAGVDITGKKVLKGKTKWYVADASIRNAILLRGEDVFTDTADLGVVVETSVINQLATYAYRTTPRLGYWHGKGDREVDLVIEAPTKIPIAIEVKYRNRVSLGAEEGIYQYLEHHSGAIGIVVTQDGQDFEIRQSPNKASNAIVTLVPAHAFLYLLGKFEYDRLNRG